MTVCHLCTSDAPVGCPCRHCMREAQILISRTPGLVRSSGLALMRIFNYSQVQREVPAPHCDGLLPVVTPLTTR
jgi:hypothetical protein